MTIVVQTLLPAVGQPVDRLWVVCFVCGAQDAPDFNVELLNSVESATSDVRFEERERPIVARRQIRRIGRMLKGLHTMFEQEQLGGACSVAGGVVLQQHPVLVLPSLRPLLPDGLTHTPQHLDEVLRFDSLFVRKELTVDCALRIEEQQQHGLFGSSVPPGFGWACLRSCQPVHWLTFQFRLIGGNPGFVHCYDPVKQGGVLTHCNQILHANKAMPFPLFFWQDVGDKPWCNVLQFELLGQNPVHSWSGNSSIHGNLAHSLSGVFIHTGFDSSNVGSSAGGAWSTGALSTFQIHCLVILDSQEPSMDSTLAWGFISICLSESLEHLLLRLTQPDTQLDVGSHLNSGLHTEIRRAAKLSCLWLTIWHARPVLNRSLTRLHTAKSMSYMGPEDRACRS